MKMTVMTNLDDAGTMLRKRGLEPNGRVQKLFTNEVARQSDPYVPMQQGILKNTRIIQDDVIIYNGPYARYHYHGKVMVGRAPKKLTDRDLKHHGAPKRGPYWDKRMWKDKKAVLVTKIAMEAGGTPEK